MELLDTPSRIRTILHNHIRARIAIIIIVLILIFKILHLIACSLELQACTDYFFERTSEVEDAIEIEIFKSYSSSLTLLFSIVSWVTFLLWFYRAYYNLSIKVAALYDSPWSAVYSWFIPVLNLTRPFFMMKEMHLETTKLLEQHQIQMPFKLSVDKVYWWWTFWNISNAVSIVIIYIPLDSDGIYFLQEQLKWELISVTLHIILGVITIQMIRGYSKLEPLLNDVPDLVEIKAPNNAEF